MYTKIIIFMNNLWNLIAGSKDEVFFESRAWLDSDCEDDFYSVNGGSRTFTHVYLLYKCLKKFQSSFRDSLLYPGSEY